MAATLEHPLSGRNKGARWAVPDFSLEARKPKLSSTTLPVGHFNLTDPAPLTHPDEEKGRSLRTSSRSASTGGLFGSSDAANRSWGFNDNHVGGSVIQLAAGLAPPAHIDGVAQGAGDDDEGEFLEQFLRDGGARALPDEVTDDVAEDETPRRRTTAPMAALAWVPSSWTTAVDKAVMNANGCIQLSGNRLVDIPSLVSDLANLRAFETRGSPFSRIQSSPAAAFNLRRSPGRTSSGSFGPVPFSPSASPTAVPIELHLGNNDITVEAISKSLWTLSNLHVLSLRQNQLDSLPEGIGRLTSLHTLNVASNQIRYLPAEILNLDNLAILNLHPNPWLAPPQPPASESSAPVAATAIEAGVDESDRAKRPRRRLLGPLTRHFSLPSLEELCIRLLLEPIGPSPELAQPLIRHVYTAAHLDVKGMERFKPLLAPILQPANAAAASSSAPFVRARHHSTSSTSASSPIGTAAPFDPLSHICRSPAHAGQPRVFYHPAVERFEWVSEASLKPAAAATTTTTTGATAPTPKRSSELRNIPIRWRGCGPTCLDWLEEEITPDQEETA
ncbi:hypothetical protein JCM10908_001694 [Rhodotorula pacifica]|uniref:leucine-rich repeat domain-containing protein n=1 Tax=Rhodotorula pacifica TaxID=1495444 RepID=UPI00317628DD